MEEYFAEPLQARREVPQALQGKTVPFGEQWGTACGIAAFAEGFFQSVEIAVTDEGIILDILVACLLYTSDAADD